MTRAVTFRCPKSGHPITINVTSMYNETVLAQCDACGSDVVANVTLRAYVEAAAVPKLTEVMVLAPGTAK